ncbi:MAG TPA: 23S rRNA (guanosine(2251)-2'-O)-methyltransferase RlmB [Prolixibacteraceae bacterium]|nr:23S rRNA (guanosine(2251)-2'-O)-methyltransferase RlmB [Bacteroidales bacterium]HPB06195.1 23S rRNA (guanosine(2251)-2'-O)-methyltransferase RlmB [Prolixibacteraceae bacterium]HQN93054.1 23S rRNA (guanosine(2251)-2'-O)-methyltransferase RlmB [Prolixibacteraceae bacterium]HUM89457.1 23S rRNA (guanosine(2251)-2'-O)-methyltransferase RlmB [Prolixibacteraceae bacterium]
MNNNDFIFGIRPIIEAIRSGKEIEKILIKKGLKGELFIELNELIQENNLHYQLVPEEKLNRLTRKNHQGVVAFISPVPFYDAEEIITRTYENGETPFFVYLDQVSDVRNFGAIVRNAECAGVHAILVPEKGSAQIGADAVKTSAGALHIVPVCKIKNPVKALETIKKNGVKIIAATEKADIDYTEAQMDGPCLLVMGAEDQGISPEILRIADEYVRIPVFGKIESLNVAVASGILMYEVVRKRKEENKSTN